MRPLRRLASWHAGPPRPRARPAPQVDGSRGRRARDGTAHHVRPTRLRRTPSGASSVASGVLGAAAEPQPQLVPASREGPSGGSGGRHASIEACPPAQRSSSGGPSGGRYGRPRSRGARRPSRINTRGAGLGPRVLSLDFGGADQTAGSESGAPPVRHGGTCLAASSSLHLPPPPPPPRAAPLRSSVSEEKNKGKKSPPRALPVWRRPPATIQKAAARWLAPPLRVVAPRPGDLAAPPPAGGIRRRLLLQTFRP